MAVVIADNISDVVRKHRLLDDKPAERLPAVHYVPYALHANVLSRSVAGPAHQRWHKSRSKY